MLGQNLVCRSRGWFVAHADFFICCECRKWGTDEKAFFKLLCASPPEYLEKINLAYADKYGKWLLLVLCLRDAR